MTKDIILFLVEGSNDSSLIERLKKLLNEDGIDVVFPSAKIVTYNTCIYPLFEAVGDDDDLDIVKLLKGKDTSGVLDEVNKNDVSQIYLFFDYDPHATNADNNKLKSLLNFFDDETDKGKLYISYPMLEVFRHSYKLVKSGGTANICNSHPYYQLSNYKKTVSQTCTDVVHIDCVITIKEVFRQSLCHANHLLFGEFVFPEHKDNIRQNAIFEKQIQLFYTRDDHPFYLFSAFPFFLYEYNIEKNFREILHVKA